MKRFEILVKISLLLSILIISQLLFLSTSVVRPTLLYIWRSSPKCAPPECSRRKSLDFGYDFPGSL
jgi:hypothetical protein